MSSLRNMSAQEISELLDEYGIKHGPVVDSTRNLYEKKLREAMSKGKSAKPSSDKTYYREEEEEVTYVYRTPVRSDGPGDLSSGSYMRSRPDWTEREMEHEPSYSSYSRSKPDYKRRDFVNQSYMYDTPATYRNSYLKATPMKSAQDAPATPKSLIPVWVRIVFFVAVAIFLYMVFSNMETNESFKGIE